MKPRMKARWHDYGSFQSAQIGIRHYYIRPVGAVWRVDWKDQRGHYWLAQPSDYRTVEEAKGFCESANG
jgi:hypothetical protein